LAPKSTGKPLEFIALVSSMGMVKDPSKYHPHERALDKEAMAAHFPLGMCLAVARVNADAPIAQARAEGWGHSPWAVGPHLYHIEAVYHLPQPIHVKGALGAYRLLSETKAAIVAQLPVAWEGVNGEFAAAVEASDLRGLSIKQPWLRRILHEGKDVENRPRPIFSTRREAVPPKTQPPFAPHMNPL
jgi:hypothetical protein